MAAAVGALDEMIKEYLVFRGFTNTLKYFDMDRKDDKDKGFKVSCKILKTENKLLKLQRLSQICLTAGQSYSGPHLAVHQ